MTAYDDIMREFREFRRYTGDGLPGAPNNAPLPVGDPQSGVYSPKKAVLRSALGNLAQELMAGIALVNGVLPALEAAKDAAIAEVHAELDEIVAKAEAARDAAEAATGSVITKDFPTRSGAEAAAIDPSASYVRLVGDRTPSDGRGGIYVRSATQPGYQDEFQSLDGAWWYPAESAEDFDPILDASNWSEPRTLFHGNGQTTSVNRVVPMQVYEWNRGQYVMLAQTFHFDPEVLSQTRLTTSLFFSEDRVNWREGEANPIFGQIEYAWQGVRAMGQALVWDHQTNKWALFFEGNGEAAIQGPPYNSIGIRCAGLARSKSLKDGTWDINPDPVLLVEDAGIQNWYPGAQRVYITGTPFWIDREQKWYMLINVGKATGGNRFNTGVVKADTLDGPWEDAGFNPILDGNGSAFEGIQSVGNGWVKVGRKYWMAFKGQSGKVGLAWSTRLDKGWQKSGALITPEHVLDRVLVIPDKQSGWTVIAGPDTLTEADRVQSWSDRVDLSSAASWPLHSDPGHTFGYQEGRFYFPAIGTIGAGTFAVSPNTLYAMPINVTDTVRVSDLLATITTGGAGSMRLGIYTNKQGKPGSLIYEGVERSTVNAGTFWATIDRILPRGRYWLAATFSGTPTMRAVGASIAMDQFAYGSFDEDPTSLSGSQGWRVNRTYGPLPLLFPTAISGTSGVSLPRIGFRAGKRN